MRKRPLRNETERLFEETMTAKGWNVMKRGMPDFACFRDNIFMLVEVKPAGTRRLSKAQYKVMMHLSRFGVPCFLWEPESAHLFPVDTLHQIAPHAPPNHIRIE